MLADDSNYPPPEAAERQVVSAEKRGITLNSPPAPHKDRHALIWVGWRVIPLRKVNSSLSDQHCPPIGLGDCELAVDLGMSRSSPEARRLNSRPAAVATAIALTALAAFLDPSVGSGRSPADPAVIVDGDTISIAGERIRLVGIDAPESFRSRCENELVLGLKAKQRLRELVDNGSIRIELAGQDRYGRTLATVFAGASTWARHCCAKGMRCPTSPAGRQSLRASRHGAGRWPRCRTRCVKASSCGMASGVPGCERHDPCRLVRRQPG